MIDIVIDVFNATAIKCSESILSAFGKKKIYVLAQTPAVSTNFK